jgi:hypothetical protein
MKTSWVDLRMKFALSVASSLGTMTTLELPSPRALRATEPNGRQVVGRN